MSTRQNLNCYFFIYELYIYIFMKFLELVTLIFLSLATTHCLQQQHQHHQQQTSLALTIYNNDFAMVKDSRKLWLPANANQSTLTFDDVSQKIQPETVTIKFIHQNQQIQQQQNGRPFVMGISEQNFQKNLVNVQKMLNKYIGKQISIVTKESNKNTRLVIGKLLGFTQGIILQTNRGIEILPNNVIIEIILQQLPEDLYTTPTLQWKLTQNSITKVEDTDVQCEIAYRTTGLAWHAGYSLILRPAQKFGDFGAWATIQNNSGKKFTNARLKLFAGDVNTLIDNMTLLIEKLLSQAEEHLQPAFARPKFSQKSFADYHLYTLNRPITLNDGSQKQIELFPKIYDVPVHKHYEIQTYFGAETTTNLKVSKILQLTNSQQNGLGIPLPQGTVNVFKQDPNDGFLEFIGQDEIEHTSKNQNITLTLKLGTQTITANRYQTYRKQNPNNIGYSSKIKMMVVNHQDTSEEVVIKVGGWYGDNLKIEWNVENGEVVKLDSNSYRLSKILKPGETWEPKWDQELTVDS